MTVHIHHCNGCGASYFPARLRCHHCGSTQFTAQALAKAQVSAVVKVHRWPEGSAWRCLVELQIPPDAATAKGAPPNALTLLAVSERSITPGTIATLSQQDDGAIVISTLEESH